MTWVKEATRFPRLHLFGLRAVSWALLTLAGPWLGSTNAQSPQDRPTNLAEPSAPPALTMPAESSAAQVLLSEATREEKSNRFSANLTLSQDSFFGFYPILNGYYDVTDRVQFSFYGQLWTTPSFSVGGSGGSGLWTEIGIGMNFKLLDGKFSFNPQIAALNGVLLSGASQPQAFEGIVPTITLNHSGDRTEGQAYVGYYLATRQPRNNDFVHWWVYGGLHPFTDTDRLLSILSVGCHFEQLFHVRNRLGATGNLYTWIGPYVQFKLPNGAYVRFASGWDTRESVSNCFYKATLGLSF